MTQTETTTRPAHLVQQVREQFVRAIDSGLDAREAMRRVATDSASNAARIGWTPAQCVAVAEFACDVITDDLRAALLAR